MITARIAEQICGVKTMDETHKESICRVIPKEDVAFFKTDSNTDYSDLFLKALQNYFSREISDRLMEILNSNDEVAVKLSDICLSNEHYLNEVRYVQQFKWTPLIRCKNCKHWDTAWQTRFGPDYHYCPMIDGIRKGDFYCGDAEPKENENEIEI